MQLFQAEHVRSLLSEEIKDAGSQRGWAKKAGVRSTDVNKVVHSRRLPPRLILDKLGLKKVAAYRQGHVSDSTPLLRAEEVIDLVKREVARAGSQSEWAREIGGRQSDISNALNGRRKPTKSILNALGLKMVQAYQRKSPDG